jgi:hypothetical protein
MKRRVEQRRRNAGAAGLMIAAVFFFLISIGIGCRKPAKPREVTQSSASLPAAGTVADIFDLRNHPNATILKPIDLNTLTDSQRKFGIAPQRDPSVEYQPDIILMEQGDKAIRSIATDGMTWTFDANAPHVSEFQLGKIVFATGRAVGRIISLKRQGGDVSVILGPIQLTDVIRRANYAMDAPIDVSNMLAYAAPDFPQPPDEPQPTKTSGLRRPKEPMEETIVVSRVSRTGKWTPTSMSKRHDDGRHEEYRRVGRRWEPFTLMPATYNPRGRGFAPPQWKPASWAGMQLPGMPGAQNPVPQTIPDQPNVRAPQFPGIPGVNLLQKPNFGIEELPVSPKVPTVDVTSMRLRPVADNSGIGLQWYYGPKGPVNGLSVVAYSLLKVHNAGIRFYLDIGNTSGVGRSGKLPLSCGIELKGAVGVKLHLDSHSTQEFNVNLHRRLWLPVEFSIPLSGVIPFSITFNQAFVIDTGFSAKNSILDATGDYDFNGGLSAGIEKGDWKLSHPTSVTAVTDIARSEKGISVGINSLVMSALLRTMAGLGTLGFNTGVYIDVRFTGTVLRAPDIGFPCGSGTIEAYLDSGVGYAIPQWVTDAINFFLRLVSDIQIDRAGSFMPGPSQRLFHGDTQIPSGCATPK